MCLTNGGGATSKRLNSTSASSWVGPVQDCHDFGYSFIIKNKIKKDIKKCTKSRLHCTFSLNYIKQKNNNNKKKLTFFFFFSLFAYPI